MADSRVVNQESWPSPQAASREPLPRVEDLPIAEQGYEQQSVKAAFESFYRHAAQLDAALRTLEAVDSFQRQAALLRVDLRALRTAGWTQQPWAVTPAYGYGAREPRAGVSPAVWRVAGEAAFLIAVAVALGLAKLHWWVIASAMAFAWLLVGLIEWAAARDRFATARAAAPAHPVVEAEPSAEQTDEVEEVGWPAFEEAQEPSDAMTIIGASPEAPAAAETPHPVRVVSTEGASETIDPWERGFDTDEVSRPEAEASESDTDGGSEGDIDDAMDPVHAEAEESRRRFRRR